MLIVALGLLALGSGINQPPLVDWDEATYAEVAHEAIANHRYLDFTWNGQEYLKKPPLLFWSLIASFKVFGESEFAARLPSVAAGVGTLLLIYLTAMGAAGRLAGTLAALFPLQFYFFVVRGGRDCATDAPLLFFITLALYAMLRAREDRRFAALAGVASGLAILAKGLAGTMPLIIAPLAVLLVPGFETIGLAGLALIFGCAAAIAAPWYVYEAVHNPLFWTSFVAHETLARVAIHLEDEMHPGWYTLAVFAREVRFLWPLVLPAGALTIVAARRASRGPTGGLGPAVKLWIVWLIVALGAACAVQTKLPWYVLPALVPIALLAGTVAASALEYRGPGRFGVAGVGAIALAMILVSVPGRWRQIADWHHYERLRSTPAYAMALRARSVASERGGGELYFEGVELPTLVYYSGMHCNFVKGSDGVAPVAHSGTQVRPTLKAKDLVLVDSQGKALTVYNLTQEWSLVGPRPSR